MEEKIKRISQLLHEAAETHHIVYKISDGDDPDWASWYAHWLINLSELPKVLGRAPVSSHLITSLVQLDRHFTAQKMTGNWEDYYAKRLVEEFSPPSSEQ